MSKIMKWISSCNHCLKLLKSVIWHILKLLETSSHGDHHENVNKDYGFWNLLERKCPFKDDMNYVPNTSLWLMSRIPVFSNRKLECDVRNRFVPFFLPFIFICLGHNKAFPRLCHPEIINTLPSIMSFK